MNRFRLSWLAAGLWAPLVLAQDAPAGPAGARTPVPSTVGEAIAREEFEHRAVLAEKARELELFQLEVKIAQEKRNLEELLNPTPEVEDGPKRVELPDLPSPALPPSETPAVQVFPPFQEPMATVKAVPPKDPPKPAGMIGNRVLFNVDGTMVALTQGDIIEGFRIMFVNPPKVSLRNMEQPHIEKTFTIP